MRVVTDERLYAECQATGVISADSGGIAVRNLTLCEPLTMSEERLTALPERAKNLNYEVTFLVGIQQIYYENRYRIIG